MTSASGRRTSDAYPENTPETKGHEHLGRTASIFVEDVERSLAFYTDQLGFTETNRYAEDGKVLVGGVHRDGCVLLLSCQQPQKNGHARYWILLGLEAHQAFRRELEAVGVAVKDGYWGFDTMIVEDPDGNELFFPVPNPETEVA